MIPMVLQVNKAYRGHRERLPSNLSESADQIDISTDTIYKSYI